MRPDVPALAARLAAAAHRLIIADYDGTLAPFDPDPDRVRILLGSAAALRALARLPDTTVAVVSGRPLADLAGRLPEGVVAVGSHGRESALWADAGPPFPAADVKRWALSRLGGRAVAWQEKPFGLAVNLRPLPQGERAEVAALLAGDCPLAGVRTLHGHAIVEWVAAAGMNKGDAARRLREESGAEARGILVIGDDATDEDMMQALREGCTVHVGEGDSEAAFRLADPRDVADFLAALEEALAQVFAGRKS